MQRYLAIGKEPQSLGTALDLSTRFHRFRQESGAPDEAIMAKGLKVGDTFLLEFRVTGLWDDGVVSATNPHLPAPIHLNEAEIPDDTVTRGKGKPKEQEKKIRYEVGVVNIAPDGKHERLTLATADTWEEAVALRDLHEAVWIDEIPVKPRKKR